ncbi:myc box-dependent-interacting protein 1 isoform X2 [Aricia agestis]|uniref:myc box-dependent-interacting protein 1 isoform X2 n=1 Tax=Aricia agestis TaxID=91739 RepID=UPI001C209364|nr:myc box-dependent-interacting protein 1 isoform X2 [Aricia agestis]
MAESKGALIAKSVQKHAGRAKEKFLQNLGKVDRTLDDIFEEHLQNFNRQHQQATRLQKEFNNYIRCIRAVQTASKSLMEAITEVYESGWSGHDMLYVQAQSMEMLWQDFSHKLGDQVLIPLNTYTNQFPELRKKIEKRGRKLVDYDSQRHNFQNLQANAAKRRDDVKITKGREQLEEARRTYESLNSELHDELPALHDSRVPFYVTNLQTLFAAEQLFHAETSKVYAELEAITDKLATECQRGSYKKPIANNVKAEIAPHNGNSTVQPNGDLPSAPPSPDSAADNATAANDNATAANGTATAANGTETAANGTAAADNGTDSGEATPPPRSPQRHNGEAKDDTYDVPAGATLAGLPAGTLYRVRATYRYTREDSDELSFDVGDVIRVVEYDDPDEQEEGWLMGIKESTNEKGMFPANFTRPI